MTAIAFDIDGQLLTIDLSQVTGREALAYRLQTGEQIEQPVARLMYAAAATDPAEQAITLADQVVVVWLYYRQNGQPLLGLPDAAGMVTLFPPTDQVGGADAPGQPPDSPPPAAPVPDPVPDAPLAPAAAAEEMAA